MGAIAFLKRVTRKPVECELVELRVASNVKSSITQMSGAEMSNLPDKPERFGDEGYSKAMQAMVGPTRTAVSVAPCRNQWRTLFGFTEEGDEKMLYRISPKGANVWVDVKYFKLILHDASKASGIEVLNIRKQENMKLIQTTPTGADAYL